MPFSSTSSSSSSSAAAMMAAAQANRTPAEVEGWLNKKGRMTWKRRYFTLHGHIITYYAKKGDAKCRNQMALTAQSVFSSSSSKKNGFSIVTAGKGFQLNAETPQDKHAWAVAVTSAIRSLQAQQAGSGVMTSSSSGRSLSRSSSGLRGRKNTKTFYVVGTEFVLDARYELIKPIGHGAYGVVISATDNQLGHKVAIKKCPNAFEDLVDAKRIVREIRLLMHFQHENIVRVLDLQAPPVADFDDVYIISELMDTDLHRVIYSRQKLTDDHVQFFLYQMLCALKYIHSANVIHRDLKPSNILLNSNCDLKICDFGLSRGVMPVGTQEASDLTEYVVTRWYRAPEIMLSCPEYTTAIDVWAVGCIFGEMLGRKPLFPGNDYIHQLKLITKLVGTPSAEELVFVTNHKARRFMLNLPKESQSSLPSNLKSKYPDASPEALSLLRKMLVIDPAKRITVAEALEQPYLASLHDPVVETMADSDVHWGDIESCELSKVNLQRQILEDMIRFHPEAKPFLRDRRIACGLPPEERQGEGSSRGTGAGVATRPEKAKEVGKEGGLKREGSLRKGEEGAKSMVDGLSDRVGDMRLGNGSRREGEKKGEEREKDDGTDDHGLKKATIGGSEAKLAATMATGVVGGSSR